MRRILIALTACVLVAGNPAEQQLREDIVYLASPALKGRGQGTPGLESAEQYLVKSYRRIGLRPEVQRYPSRGRSVRTQVEARLQDGKPLTWDQEISILRPMNASMKGAPLVLGSREWPKDLKGKVAVLLLESDAPLLSKRIADAAQAGASAILLLGDPGDEVAELTLLLTQIPLLKMPRAIFEAHVPEARAVIAGGPDTSLGTLDLQVSYKTEEVQAPNLAIVIPGRDPKLKKEYIALGAHFDHLGEDPGLLSLAKGEARKQIHPGADDNASGSALVMDLARHLRRHRTRRSILLLHFSGEELGLLGSAYWAKHATVPLEQVKFFFNFDMVGRMDPAKPRLDIGRIGVTKADGDLIDRHVPRNIPINHDLGLYLGASDHLSLATQKIPAVFFFTGVHSDYHRPSDTPDKINYAGTARVEGAALGAIREMANAGAAPSFDLESAQWLFPKPATIRKAIFGAQPADETDPRGLLLDDSRENTPAAELGLRAGDVLVSFNGSSVKTLFDLNAALAACSAGDRVKVSWIRDGKSQEVEAVLKAPH